MISFVKQFVNLNAPEMETRKTRNWNFIIIRLRNGCLSTSVALLAVGVGLGDEADVEEVAKTNF